MCARVARQGIGKIVPTVLIIVVAGALMLGVVSGPLLDMIGLGNATLFGFGDTADPPEVDGGGDGETGDADCPTDEDRYSCVASGTCRGIGGVVRTGFVCDTGVCCDLEG